MTFESANTRKGLLSIWLSAVIAVAISFVAANPAPTGQWSERMSVSYRMGEADSQMTAMRMARDKLRQKAISESGAYIQNTQILSDDRFTESVQLLKAAFVFLSEDSFRMEVDPGSLSQTLHYEALVTVDTETLRDRVAALQNSTSFESDLKRLYLTDRAIGTNLGRLEKKLGSSGLSGDMLSSYKDALTKAREATLKQVVSLNPTNGSSLLERSQYGSGILELGKLRALEKYYFDILGTYSNRLVVDAKVVSAAPSSAVANATEVTVDMTITFSADQSRPSGNVIYEINLMEQKLKSIQRGDFWLGTAEGGPSSKMQAMRLGGYDDWVDTELSNMPLVVVTSLGSHERYFTALGGSKILKDKGSRIEFNRKGSQNFQFPGAFTSKYPAIYSNSSSTTHKRFDKRTYVFQLPNEEAAVINAATVELRLMKIPK